MRRCRRGRWSASAVLLLVVPALFSRLFADPLVSGVMITMPAAANTVIFAEQ